MKRIATLLLAGGVALEAYGQDIGTAWREVEVFDFARAGRHFEESARTAQAGTPGWIEATAGLALSLHQQQPDRPADKDRAARLYDELIAALRNTPTHPVYALALYERARLAQQTDGKPGDEELARRHLRTMLAECADPLLVNAAVLDLAQLDLLRMKADDVRRGITLLEDWLRSHPANPLAAAQWLQIAMARTYPLQEPAQALQAYLAADAAGIANLQARPAVYWRIGQLAEELGDRDTAVRYYRMILQDLGRTPRAYEAQARLRQLGDTAAGDLPAPEASTP